MTNLIIEDRSESEIKCKDRKNTIEEDSNIDLIFKKSDYWICCLNYILKLYLICIGMFYKNQLIFFLF